jgi:hypothetical protein
MKRHEDRETLERIKRWPNLVTRFPRVRIYSAEWGAFWRGKGSGYTENAEESDVLDIGHAVARTSHCGPEKQIQYVAANPNYGNRWNKEQRKAAAKRRRDNPTVIDPKTGINIAKLPEVRKKISQTKMGLLNPRASLWKLVSPSMDEFMIEGGIKHEIKRYGVDYQQFTIVVDHNTRMNHNGWQLVKLPKPKLEEQE